MKIVFRVAYHTVPGQSLWLKLSIVSVQNGTRMEQSLPMRWLNLSKWELDMDIAASGIVRIETTYQLRQENNGICLDEWNAPRIRELDFTRAGSFLMEDTWCSAGTVDYALDTSVFAQARPEQTFPQPTIPQSANHEFFLSMTALPQDTVPCLLGGVSELGDWNPDLANPLTEISPDLWHTALYLPADWQIEYKYGLFHTGTRQLLSMESGENRILEPRVIGDRQHTLVSDEGYRRPASDLPRAAGVSIPVFSLRSTSSLGVGEFADLKPFADWASDAGLRLIQVLPINDTTAHHDWTDSYPYSAISVFALHPLYLRVENLSVSLTNAEQEEIDKARASLNPLPEVDYVAVTKIKSALTRRIFQRHAAILLKREDIRTFIGENQFWLTPYAAFCVLRDSFGTADFSKWQDLAQFDEASISAFASPDHPDYLEFSYHLWLQFELDRQLRDAIGHLHARDVSLKGDLPIGIDRHSCDAWSAPHLFHMDRQAGAPPDAFAVKGQNWGFPTYNWDAMAKDGYAWWASRLTHLSRYFDAFRIDHILGFFRIWQIPTDQIDGIMGYFEPAIPIHIDEIRARGISFTLPRFCQPYLCEDTLIDWLGDDFEETRDQFLENTGWETYRLRPEFSTQRKIADHFDALTHPDKSTQTHADHIRSCLMDIATEVLLIEVPGSQGTLFHPRYALYQTQSWKDLDADTRQRLIDLHDDYFHRRQDDFWQARGYEKLPALRKASPMLLCGEDLGMVPDCVPGVMRELGILSLEIQRMPKSAHQTFAHPAEAPYLSVVSPSTHDMSTLRGWWKEDSRLTSEFAWQCLGLDFPPSELTTDLAQRIIHQHLESPAMWAIFPLQDLLALDETLRHPDTDAERINVPAITPWFWRYRMHLDLSTLHQATAFNQHVRHLIQRSGRMAPSVS
jgi:4-alpha-glucanotransferase